MWPSDIYDCQDLLAPPARARLPINVEPGRDEALCSWICRLSQVVGLSARATARFCFGIESLSDGEWWLSPGAARLAAISERSGLPLDRVRAMTFDSWSRARDDETPQRFSVDRIRQRLRRTLPGRSLRVCSECLAEDPKPYLRLEWIAGWTAVCPRHRSILMEVCPYCCTGLRLPSSCSTKPVKIGQCHRCGGSLAGMVGAPAHDAVLLWQDRLLEIKRRGFGVAGRLGLIDWPSLVALIDALLRSIWIDTNEAIRARLFDRVIEDQGGDPEEEDLIWWGDDYGALLITAWIFEEWPDRLNTALALLKAPRPEVLVGRLTNIEPANEDATALIRSQL